MAKGKPGVMIYFETGKAIKGLDYETKGRLFEAIMEYGEHGNVPPLEGVLAAVWPFVANSIDRDAKSYEKTVLSRKRAAFAKWWPDYARANRIDVEDKVAKEQWIDQQMENDANASNSMQMHANACFAMQNMPTTTPTPAPTRTSTPITTATTAGVLIPVEEKHPHGRYRNVFLTAKEYEGLIIDIPLVINLIEKLSEHMQSTGRNYESHEATIRKWAREDEEKRRNAAQQTRNSGNIFYDIAREGTGL